MSWAPNGRSDRLRIIALGYLVRCPVGGIAWHYMRAMCGLAAPAAAAIFGTGTL